MDDKVRRCTDSLTWELRSRGVSGEGIGDTLAQVESHCAESGEDPKEAFGPARSYAKSFAPSMTRTSKWLRYLLHGLAGLVLGSLLALGVAGAMNDEQTVWGLSPQLVVAIAGIAIAGYLIALASIRRRQIRDPRKELPA